MQPTVIPSLRFRADRRSLAFLTLYSSSVATGFVLWGVLPLPALALLSAFTCFAAFVVAVIVHNTVHLPMFHDRRHNRRMQVFLSVAYGHPVSAYVSGHNLSHHTHTQTAKDVMRTSKVRFRWNLLNGLLFFLRVAPDIHRANTAFAAAMKTQRPRWHAQYRLETWVVVGVSVALAALHWKAFLLFFVLPHAFGGWGIVSVNYLQHDGADSASRFDHSRNFTGRALNWVLLNNGYHGIHHMQPGLHWSLLPEAHRASVAPHINPSLDQRSALAYLWRTFVWPGRRSDFRGQPLTSPKKVPDDDWIPRLDEVSRTASWGAESAP